MKKDATLPIFLLFNLIILVIFFFGCSLSTLEQSPKNALEPIQPPESTTTKTSDGSIFTVIDLEDLEYPTLAASIRLPYRVNPNNTVVLASKHAYITTEKHLHVIDVSVPQLPSYRTTLAFPDEIVKISAYGNHLVVTGHQESYIIDISVPAQPVIQSTTKLPNHGKMQQITLHPLVDTVENDNKIYEGQITDFQISGNLLYIVNKKGVFSIFRIYNLDDLDIVLYDLDKVYNLEHFVDNFVDKGKLGKVLSTTPLQAICPLSIAIGEHHAYVLSIKKEK